MSPDAADRRRPARLIGVLLAILIIRLIVAALTPLTEDEAYYRLWAQAPAFGYVDHPPMIAWWVALGRALVGDSSLGVRLLPTMASALVSLLVFDMTALAGASRETAGRAALWFNATLLVALGAMLAVPDAPAALFWSLTLWCVMRDATRPWLGWWVGAGAAAGLACLSKYSALFLGPGVLFWLVFDPVRRRRLATPGPWIALLIAGSIFSLNVAWNAGHDWLTFHKQFGRVAARAVSPRFLPELILAQILLLNPLVVIPLLRARARLGERASLLWMSCLPFAAYLVIHSLHDRVQAHWPAPLYPALAILAAMAADRAGARLKRLAPAFTLLVIGAIAALALAPASLFSRLPDPFLPLRGWGEFSRRVDTDRVKAGAAWIGVSSYGLASQLADQGPRAPLWQISERDRWRGPSPGALPDLTRPGLVVDLPRRVSAAKLQACFGSVRKLPPIPRGLTGERPKLYAAFLVSRPLKPALAAGCW